MSFEEFKEFFKEELEKNSIELKEEEFEKFYYYMNGIIEWNTKINVTSITDGKMFIVKHFIDSLTISKYIKDKYKIIDIGTGAGFPGVPLAIKNKNSKVTLIDSVNKKLEVIKDVSSKNDINNLEIIHTRAEDLAHNIKFREIFDVATTRAVSNFSTIAEYMIPFIKVGGIAICMKGPNYEQELEESKKAIQILGGKIEKIEKFIIDNDIERNIIIIRKIKNSPKEYPRRGGKPLKEPIR